MTEHYPSLFLLCNGYDAKWYRVTQHGVEELLQLKDEKGTYTDREGFFMTKGAGQGGIPDTENQLRDQEEDHHFRAVAKQTHVFLEKESFRHVAVAIPEQHKHRIAEQLHQVLSQQEFLYTYGNYTHLEKEAVHDMFIKALQHRDT